MQSRENATLPDLTGSFQGQTLLTQEPISTVVTIRTTCDGEDPKEDNKFTTILNIVIPREESEVRYASIIPCISWSDKSSAIKKVELKETVFEWIRREQEE